ncbi:MAG: hypothetical protein AAFX65_12550 [Cyanobacteria bacterium J06638_7]
MSLFVSLFVGKPLVILMVAACFVAAYLAYQFRWPDAGFHPRALLIGGIAWSLYALWEGLVLLITPDANIRVDLLVIWPLLALLSFWSVLRAFRSAR